MYQTTRCRRLARQHGPIVHDENMVTNSATSPMSGGAAEGYKIPMTACHAETQ